MHWDPPQLVESVVLPVVIHLVLFYFVYQRLICQARHAYDKHKQPAPRRDGVREPRASPSSKTKEPDIKSSGSQSPARHSDLGEVSRTVETISKRHPRDSAQKGTRKMASAAKIGANRRNALASTGPKTASGKSHSRFNAVKHGIYATAPVLPGEDEHAYRELLRSYEEHFVPVGPVEAILVQQITAEHWKLDRTLKAEISLHVRLRETRIVHFLHRLSGSELGYIRSAHSRDLTDEIDQQLREESEDGTSSDAAELAENLGAADIEIVEHLLSRVREMDRTVLEALVPETGDGPQLCLDRERRMTMRVYLNYTEKLEELQQARRELQVLP